MKFEWDAQKAKANKAKHNVSFEEAQSVFSDEFARVIFDESHSNDEARFVILGLSQRLRILVVVHCFRSGNSTIRIISARKATQNEQKQYKELRK
ncbi:BrnT family toxin [Helicobacter jaachi]|uniref:BrnT family toxin n=1 Tax=Helicobacter jaachi TaxID=1677920 RepID=A0A4U8TCJ0_9HELI|nr:BrnT family toxin [Helicobacter jaachi]TLD97686.1 BrnT family toxin [Helicobacter jaachi]